MQISSNTTGMQAGLAVAMDKEGRDYCVVVVKGTFTVDNHGTPMLAEKQEPLVYADVYYGDPAATSIQYECDFARFKRNADVIVNGHAYSPTGEPVQEVEVVLEIGAIKKHVRVVGNRYWRKRFFTLRPSTPIPFVKMPLVFDRAFGGSDHSHQDPKYHGTEVRNPVGMGFRKNPDLKTMQGTPLPNLEHPRHRMRKWSDTPPPVNFGILGRNWQPRIHYAGTYDDRWLGERFPFLPEDFDDRYFQAAPADQQIPFLQGGEVVRCTNMTPEGTCEFAVPTVEVPVLFRFRDREDQIEANLDTLIVEPDQRQALLVWRATVPVGQKLNALLEVYVGRRPRPRPSSIGKLRFVSLAEFISAKKAALAL